MGNIVLVIDDERLLCKHLKKVLTDEGYETFTALTGKDGLKLIDRESPDIVLLDLKLPDIDGMEILRKIQYNDDDVLTIIMTAHGSVENAVSAVKIGAYDFIEKPFSIDKLKLIVKNAFNTLELKRNLSKVKEQEFNRYSYDILVGKSKKIKELIVIIKKVVEADAKTILLTGETGTGKGLIAKLIHYNSIRKDQPFIDINCAAIPENLLESELFGFEAGAFTDAKKTKKGLFELANKGTIFLDEIGDMSLPLQAKLLKVLDEKSFRRVGGLKNINCDVKIIVGTNRNLKSLVNSGNFRKDLYFRLNVINIKVPPLRERKEDISVLTDYFIEYFNRETHRNVTEVPENVRLKLQNYHWPGNVRELKNVIERAVILSKGSSIQENLLEFDTNDEDFIIKISEKECFVKFPKDEFNLQKLEEKVLSEFLKKNNWNQTRTAKDLGISRDRLRHKMKKLNLI